MLFLDLPPVQPLQAQVRMLSAAELGSTTFSVKTTFQVNHELDSDSDEPMTAKQAVEALYKERYLKNIDEKSALIERLGELENKNPQIPRYFYNSVRDIARNQIFTQDDFETLVYDLSPLATLKAGRLVLDAFKNTKALSDAQRKELKKQALQVLDIFLKMPESEVDEILKTLN